MNIVKEVIQIILWQRVIKGRKRSLAGVRRLRPVPIIVDGLLEAANDGCALLRYRFGIGVLFALHDDSCTVNSQILLQYPISLLNARDLAEE